MARKFGWMLLAVLLVIFGTCWYGFRRMTADGGRMESRIGAPVDRVFATLTDPDSMLVWMHPGTRISPLGGGQLRAGDSLQIIQPGDTATASDVRSIWRVLEVAPPSRFVIALEADSAGSARTTVVVLTDSLVAISPDSTLRVTTMSSPLIDSVSAKASGESRFAGAILGAGRKMMIAGVRLVAEAEGRRLKARVEGKPMPD